MNNETLLRARGVTKTYTKDGAPVEVLRGVDFELREGETLAILGSSGAGKSTLLHVLGTLEPPTEGEVLYYGQDVTNFSSEKVSRFRNREIGFVFQFHYLLQEFSALENVLMPALIAGEDRPKYEERARALLTEVGLSHRLTHRPAELSGGEQQRVALARALIMHPRVLLADEPTGNLDSANAQKVKDLFLELSKSRGITIALVTHDEDIAKDFGRHLVMKDGVIADDRKGKTH
ncbi:MAG TPA: ABC transporter ATP-binding protein [Bdellovibrionota bacterium]|jgi:lipoprotein-releasing system ATP-binding protein